MIHLATAWSGRIHLFERYLGLVAAEPVGPYNRVSKPARQQVLTTCGEQIYLRKEERVEHVNLNHRSLCDKCRNVIGARQAKKTTEYTAHNVDWCLYERYVGHLLEDDEAIGKFPGFVHPDACPDCAANPEVAAQVHKAETANEAAIQQLAPFFGPDIPHNILLKMFMSAMLAHQCVMEGITEEEMIEQWKKYKKAKGFQ